MAKTPSERMEDLAEAMRKLTDTDERLVKVQEERLVEARKVEQQRASWDNLGAQLRESLLAPLKGLASMIPAPLRILAKMPVAGMVKGHLARKQAKLEAGGLEAAGGTLSDDAVMGGALTPSLAGVASAVTGGSIGVTADPDSRWGQMVEAFAGINSTLDMIAEASLELFHLEDISDFVGELATSGEKTSEKLEEIDENTEPKKVSKAKIKEDELEARKKKPSISTIKKLGPLAPNWKTLLIGLGMMAGSFGIAKAIQFWQDVIIPAGGFKKWWTLSGWPTMFEWAKKLGNNVINAIGGVFGVEEGQFQKWWDETGSPAVSGFSETFIKTIIPALVTSITAALIKFIDDNKEAWIARGRALLGNLPQNLFVGLLSMQAGGWLGMKVGAIIGSAVPGLGTVVGAIIGLLVGAALGAIMGWVASDSIQNMKAASENQLKVFWAQKKKAAIWGAFGGAAAAGLIVAAMALAPFTAGLSIPAMIAFLLISAGIGALMNFLTGGFDPTEIDEETETNLHDYRTRADDATKGWLERNIWDPIGRAIDFVAGIGQKGEDVAAKHKREQLERLGMELRTTTDPERRAKLEAEIEELKAAPLHSPPTGDQGGTRLGTDTRGEGRVLSQLEKGLFSGSITPDEYYRAMNPVPTINQAMVDKVQAQKDAMSIQDWLPSQGVMGLADWKMQQFKDARNLQGGMNEFEMYQKLTGGSDQTGGEGGHWERKSGSRQKVWVSDTVENSLPHIRTDLGQALNISHGVFPASIPAVASAVMGGGGGDVGFNSMANVSTTNITQAKTRDVGMALAFDKRKNNRLGYAV